MHHQYYCILTGSYLTTEHSIGEIQQFSATHPKPEKLQCLNRPDVPTPSRTENLSPHYTSLNPLHSLAFAERPAGTLN